MAFELLRNKRQSWYVGIGVDDNSADDNFFFNSIFFFVDFLAFLVLVGVLNTFLVLNDAFLVLDNFLVWNGGFFALDLLLNNSDAPPILERESILLYNS